MHWKWIDSIIFFKLIIINCIAIDIIFALPFPLCWPLKICACLPRKYGRFMLLIDNNLLLPVAKLYWLISTENDHRHHHKFIEYEKRLRKEGYMLDLPINNDQAKSLPLQREIWRVALLWVRSIQRQRSNWPPTYILHLFHLEDTSLLFIFLSESVKVRFLPRVDSFSFAQEPHLVYCF